MLAEINFPAIQFVDDSSEFLVFFVWGNIYMLVLKAPVTSVAGDIRNYTFFLFILANLSRRLRGSL